MGGPSWNTEAGRLKFVGIVKRNIKSASTKEIDREYWIRHNPGAMTRLPIACLDCGYVSSSPLRCIVDKATVLMCPCNPKFPFCSEAGRLKVLATIAMHSPTVDISILTADYWSATRPSLHTKVPVGCKECGFFTSVQIAGLVNQKVSPRCPCHPTFPWGSKEGLRRFLSDMAIKHPRIELVSFTPTWWSVHKPTNDSILRSTCKTCNVSVSFCLSQIVRGTDVRCACPEMVASRKTENKLFRWLLDNVDPLVTREQAICKSSKSRKCRLDFSVFGASIGIELDGGLGHFGVGWGRVDDAETPIRDKMKEDAAIEKGMSIVRVLQTDVWGDKNDWQNWMLSAIEECRSKPDPPRVIVPNRSQYSSGVYAELRSDMCMSVV